jgi:hypothetical protein
MWMVSKLGNFKGQHRDHPADPRSDDRAASADRPGVDRGRPAADAAQCLGPLKYRCLATDGAFSLFASTPPLVERQTTVNRTWQPAPNPQSRVMRCALLPLAESFVLDAKRSEYGSYTGTGRWSG